MADQKFENLLNLSLEATPEETIKISFLLVWVITQPMTIGKLLSAIPAILTS